MTNKYAIIPILEFNEEMLIDQYPVVIEYDDYMMIEYNDELDPTGGWLIFEGVDSNKKITEYLENNGY